VGPLIAFLLIFFGAGLRRRLAQGVGDAGHGSVVVAEQIKQLALQLDFAAKHLGTTPALA